jgi:hypothetical protein
MAFPGGWDPPGSDSAPLGGCHRLLGSGGLRLEPVPARGPRGPSVPAVPAGGQAVRSPVAPEVHSAVRSSRPGTDRFRHPIREVIAVEAAGARHIERRGRATYLVEPGCTMPGNVHPIGRWKPVTGASDSRGIGREHYWLIGRRSRRTSCLSHMRVSDSSCRRMRSRSATDDPETEAGRVGARAGWMLRSRGHAPAIMRARIDGPCLRPGARPAPNTNAARSALSRLAWSHSWTRLLRRRRRRWFQSTERRQWSGGERRSSHPPATRTMLASCSRHYD